MHRNLVYLESLATLRKNIDGAANRLRMARVDAMDIMLSNTSPPLGGLDQLRACAEQLAELAAVAHMVADIIDDGVLRDENEEGSNA